MPDGGVSYPLAYVSALTAELAGKAAANVIPQPAKSKSSLFALES